MDLSVLAAGIETREQLDFLLRHGCEAGQGCFFSPPVAAPEVEARLLPAAAACRRAAKA